MHAERQRLFRCRHRSASPATVPPPLTCRWHQKTQRRTSADTMAGLNGSGLALAAAALNQSILRTHKLASKPPVAPQHAANKPTDRPATPAPAAAGWPCTPRSRAPPRPPTRGGFRGSLRSAGAWGGELGGSFGWSHVGKRTGGRHCGVSRHATTKHPPLHPLPSVVCEQIPVKVHQRVGLWTRRQQAAWRRPCYCRR